MKSCHFYRIAQCSSKNSTTLSSFSMTFPWLSMTRGHHESIHLLVRPLRDVAYDVNFYVIGNVSNIVPPIRCSVIGRPTGRSVRPVGCSVHTLRQSDRQSGEIKHVWFFRPSVRPVERSVYTIRSSDVPTGRTDRAVRRSYRVDAQICWRT